MSAYEVFESSEGKYEAVEHGFNPLAFMYGLALPSPGFMGVLWPFVEVKQLRYGLYVLVLLIVFAVAGGALNALLPGIEAGAGALVAVVGALAFGFFGNRWRARSLRTAGARCVGEEVEAWNEDEAITTVKPDIIRRNRLIKSAERALRDGHPEDAVILYEHALTECRGDRNVVAFVREGLRNLELGRSHVVSSQA